MTEFWRDIDARVQRPCSEYVSRWPELRERIEAEFAAASAARAASTTSAVGNPASIGRYRILGRLTEGGMGLLLRGRDDELARDVVLKTLPHRLDALDPRAQQRLLREAQIGARLDHDNICPVLDVVVDDNRAFVVMPYVAGADLAAWIDGAARRTLPIDSAASSTLAAWCLAGDLRGAVALLEQVARAIAVAHAAHVVHRDLKPANIMVRPDGAPVILDFGVAHQVEPTGVPLTMAGDTLGSPPYMAPEQIHGKPVDQRTDVYALGVILYELITGKRPFPAGSTAQALGAILAANPLTPRRHNPRIPRDLDAVCMKAMAAEPAARYATAIDLAEDLARVLRCEATFANPPSVTTRLWRRLRRRPGVLLASAAALAAAAALGHAWWSRTRLTESTRATAAALRIWESLALHRAPVAGDVEVVRRLFAADTQAAPLLEALQTRDLAGYVTQLIERLDSAYRGDGDEPALRIVRPRAGVVADQLGCTVELTEPPTGAWHLTITVEDGHGEVWSAAQSVPEGRVAEVAWPPTGPQQPDGEYRIVATVRPATPPGELLTTAVRIRSVPTAVRMRLQAAGADLEPAVRALVLASALLSHDLAADAVQVLDTAPPCLSPGLDNARTVLLARALGKLEDRARLQRLAR